MLLAAEPPPRPRNATTEAAGERLKERLLSHANQQLIADAQPTLEETPAPAQLPSPQRADRSLQPMAPPPQGATGSNQSDHGAARPPGRVHTASTLRRIAQEEAERARAQLLAMNTTAKFGNATRRRLTPNSREGYLRWLRGLRENGGGTRRT